MKSLIIARDYPLPEISGDRIRTMNFVRYLRKFGRVDLLVYDPINKEMELGFLPGKLFHIKKDLGSHRCRLSQIYEKIKYSKPWSVCSYTKECVYAVTKLIEKEKYDIILCRYALDAYPLFFLNDLMKKNVIIDIDDMITRDLYETLNGSTIGISRIKFLIDYQLNKSYQHKCAKIGTALICSHKDRSNLEKGKKAGKVFVVPNIISPPNLPNNYIRDGHNNLNKILFVGNLLYPPNVDGLKWFITEIFTRLDALGSNFSLMIAGRDTEPSLRSFCDSYSRIQLIGTPPDLVPLYEQCGMVIVPLLAGGGTRIKILEAGHKLRPVISTKIGAEGLGLLEYDHFLLMNDYTTFIERYQWLCNRDNYHKLVANMQQYIAENYSVEIFNRSMDSVMKSIVSR